MTGLERTAELKASIDVRPSRSQVFLVASAIVVAISIICGASLIALDKHAGWVFVVFAGVALWRTFAAWRDSQSDVDLHNAHPTKIALPNGTSLSTDSRTLRSPDGVRGLAQMLDGVLSRKPLPPPDGLVDDNGQIIPESKARAAAIANQVNSDIQQATNIIMDTFGVSDTDNLVTQRVSDLGDTAPDVVASASLNITSAN